MNNFAKLWLTLNDMITPKIITVIYWLGMVLVIIAFVVQLFILHNLGYALLTLVAGVIGVRVYCELTILFFNIYTQVKRIADTMESKSATNTDNTTKF